MNEIFSDVQLQEMDGGIILPVEKETIFGQPQDKLIGQRELVEFGSRLIDSHGICLLSSNCNRL